jgi:hypothetical protein
MIIAYGIDLFDITRLLTDPSDQFLTRCFTPQEPEAVGTNNDYGWCLGQEPPGIRSQGQSFTRAQRPDCGVLKTCIVSWVRIPCRESN